MTLPKPMSWNRQEARVGKFDGKFIIGVLTTSIYCLPSCAARPPKPENVQMFATEADAQAAGLRACKRCRPDLYSRGQSEDAALFEGLRARLRADLESFAGTRALAATAGVGIGKLTRLVKAKTGLSPAAWLKQERIRAAEALLRSGNLRVTDIAFAVGFAAESAFHRQFVTLNGLPPAAWRARHRSAGAP